MNKQEKTKIIRPENSMVVTKGKEGGVDRRGKGVKYRWQQMIWIWVVGTQYNTKIIYHRIVHLKPHFINQCHPNEFNKKEVNKQWEKI